MQVWSEATIEQRVGLWASHYSTLTPSELRRGVRASLDELSLRGVTNATPQGGCVGLVASGTLCDGRRAVVKIGPYALTAPEAALYALASQVTPELFWEAQAHGVGTVVMSHAGTSPPYGSLAVKVFLDVAEEVSRLAAGVTGRGLDASWYSQDAARSSSHARTLLESPARQVDAATTLGLDLATTREVVGTLADATQRLPERPERFTGKIHGDLHDDNLLVDVSGAVRAVDPKVVPGSLCVDAGYMAVMLRDADGVGVGRAREVLDAAAVRRWGRGGCAAAWARWFAARKVLVWLVNGSASATEIRRAVSLSLGELDPV